MPSWLKGKSHGANKIRSVNSRLFKLRSFIFGSIVIACALGACGCSRESERGLNPGDTPPEIRFKDLDGKVRSLEEFKGKVVLLNFWASWCAPCMAEMPELERSYQAHRGEGLEIVAVGINDTADNLAGVKKKFNLSFPILIDESGTSKKLYKLGGFPESFVLDRDGRLQLTQDPESGEATVRIIGPRMWSSPKMLSVLNLAN